MKQEKFVENLEIFGLNEYESKAYSTLIKQGIMPVSELSYHSGVPRTKSYSTLKALERKGLVTLMSTNPTKYQAVSPEESFEKAINTEEKKVKGMKETFLELKKINEEANKHDKSQERKYLVVNSNTVINKISEIINSSRFYFHGLTDSWGNKILNEAIEVSEIVPRKDIDFKIVASDDSELGVNKLFRADKTLLRIAENESGYSCFLSDDNVTLLVNSNTGTGLYQNSNDLCQILDRTTFKETWDNGIQSEQIKKLTTHNEFSEVSKMIYSAEKYKLFIEAVAEETQNNASLKTRIGTNFIERLEREMNVTITKQPIEISLPLLVTLLQQDIDKNIERGYSSFNKRINLDDSEELNNAESIWYYALIGILERSGLAIDKLKDMPEAKQITNKELSTIRMNDTELKKAIKIKAR